MEEFGDGGGFGDEEFGDEGAMDADDAEVREPLTTTPRQARLP